MAGSAFIFGNLDGSNSTSDAKPSTASRVIRDIVIDHIQHAIQGCITYLSFYTGAWLRSAKTISKRTAAPSNPDGPYPHSMLYGHRGKAPSKAMTKIINKIVDNVIARPFWSPFLNVRAHGIVPPQIAR